MITLVATFAVGTSYIPFENKNTEPKDKISTSEITSVNPSSLNEEKISSAENLYKSLDFKDGNILQYNIFEKAINGFNQLKESGKLKATSKLLTICDFSLSSNEKRLWIINTVTGEILFNTLVAHGKNTGEEFAEKFSNTESSLQSSMGFYITDQTYFGENGYSLRLRGMDAGYNDAAERRAVVMHGADYVSEEFTKKHGRIGRSWGCPAIPRAVAKSIIDTIKEENCLFIYYPDQEYLSSSQWLKTV